MPCLLVYVIGWLSGLFGELCEMMKLNEIDHDWHASEYNFANQKTISPSYFPQYSTQ